MANYSNLPGVTSLSYTPQKNTNNPMQDYTNAQNAANQANITRANQGLGLWDTIVGLYNFGGAYEQSAMNSYEAGKRQSLASAGASLIGSGMYNTTTTAGLGAKYEEQVGTPTRLSVAAEQAKGKAGALQGAAGFLSSINQNAPDASLYANLAKGASKYSSTDTSKPLESMSGYYGGSSAPVSSGGYQFSTGGDASFPVEGFSLGNWPDTTVPTGTSTGSSDANTGYDWANDPNDYSWLAGEDSGSW